MLAASYWSLLAPAIEMAEDDYGAYAFVPVAIGFGIGAAFVLGAERLLPLLVRGYIPNLVQLSYASLLFCF